MDYEERSRLRLAWALEKAGLNIRIELANAIDSFLLAFESDSRHVLSIPREWLDDCDPHRGYMTPGLRAVLKHVRGIVDP